MYHFVYKTVRDNGDYYYGKHSTNNIYDGYQGSGRRVKNIQRKGGNLITGIIEFLPKLFAFIGFYYLHEMSPLKDIIGREWYAWVVLFV